MKRIAMVLLGVTLLLTVRTPLSAAELAGSEVETLVAEALAHNPEIVAEQRTVADARCQVPAGRRP